MFEVDRRTLNRWLEKEGETFSSLLQSVRMDIARHGINEGNCSLTELSDALGFTSLRARQEIAESGGTSRHRGIPGIRAKISPERDI